jgi:hypothetical protein
LDSYNLTAEDSGVNVNVESKSSGSKFQTNDGGEGVWKSESSSNQWITLKFDKKVVV